MVCILNAITFRKNSFANKIKVLDLSWEPWHSFGTDFGHLHTRLAFDLSEAFLNVGVFKVSDEINVEIHCSFAASVLWGLRLNSSHVYAMIFHSRENLAQLAGLIINGDDYTGAVLSLPEFERLCSSRGGVHTAHSAEGTREDGVEFEDVTLRNQSEHNRYFTE